jgi:hypothetical protein
MTFVPRGRYFGEFMVGEAFTSAARTVTESAVDLFAGLSGDFNPLHTTRSRRGKGPMKGRIAQGMLVRAMATGQVNQLGLFEGTTLAPLGMEPDPVDGRHHGRGGAEPAGRDGLPGRVDDAHGAASRGGVTAPGLAAATWPRAGGRRGRVVH